MEIFAKHYPVLLMNRLEQILYWSFFFCLLVTFQPIKIISFVSYLAFFIPIFIFDTKRQLLSVNRLLVAVFCFILLFIFYGFIVNTPENYLQINHWLSIFFWGHIWLFIALNRSKLGSFKLQKKIFSLLLIFIAIQGIVGVLQFIVALYLSNEKYGVTSSIGDFVSGTVGGWTPALKFENPTYVINMIGLLLYVVIFSASFLGKIRLKWALVIALASVLLAGVVHLVLMFVCSLTIAVLLILMYLGRISKRTKYVLFLLPIIITIFYFFYGGYIQGHFLGMSVAAASSAKIAVTTDMIFNFPQEGLLYPAFGVGPGQMISKVSVFRSGFSLQSMNFEETGLPFIPPKHSSLSDTYLFNHIKGNPILYASSLHSPFYGLMTLYSEFGIVGLLLHWVLLIIFFIKTLRRIKKYKRHTHSLLWGLGCCTMLLFFLMVSFISYYIEISQCVFIPMLVTYMCYNNIGASSHKDLPINRPHTA